MSIFLCFGVYVCESTRKKSSNLRQKESRGVAVLSWMLRKNQKHLVRVSQGDIWIVKVFIMQYRCAAKKY